MRRTIGLICCAAALLAAAPQEPSAFGAGNLDSAQPYGLSEEEKHILANKKAIEALQKRVLKQQQIIEHNAERIDGLQSILEGLNARIRTYDKALKRVDELNATVAEMAAADDRNFEQIRTVLKELGAMIDSINAKYVDRERFEKLEKAFLAFKNSYEAYVRKNDLSGKSNAQIFSEAKRFFSKKRYDEARVRFEHLIAHHYKPATSNYYLGEIAYREGRYKEAVAHYKKSASLYDKSRFMPTLLLHTAVSLQRLGKKSEAKKFYRSVIDLYPKSAEAKTARKNLAKLK